MNMLIAYGFLHLFFCDWLVAVLGLADRPIKGKFMEETVLNGRNRDHLTEPFHYVPIGRSYPMLVCLFFVCFLNVFF